MSRANTPFVTSHSDLASHPKIENLCDSLYIDVPHAVGIVHLMWHWCAENAPEDGRLTLTPEELAQIARWRADPEELWRCLVACEWIDVRKDGRAYAHEWKLYGGKYNSLQQKRERDRLRLARIRAEEAAAILVPLDAGYASPGVGVPEAERVHTALFGASREIEPLQKSRIEEYIRRYPGPDPYEVALEYMAWQIKRQEELRDGRNKGADVHTDHISGWKNQMRMNDSRGWRPRDKRRSSEQKTALQLTEEDVRRYHTGAPATS